MFPTTYTWLAVTTGISDFLAEPIVLGGTMFVLSLALAPRAVRAIKSTVSGR